MVSVADIATANNTVAILVTGNVAKELSEEYGVEPKRAASLLDLFACVFQGILPYSAQILFACAMMEHLNSPFQVISLCWYQYIVAVIAVLSIFIEGKKKAKASGQQ